MFFCMFIYSELLIASFTFILGVFLFIIQNIFMIFVVGPSKKFIESKTRLKCNLLEKKHVLSVWEINDIKRINNYRDTDGAELYKLGVDYIVKYENLNFLAKLFACAPSKEEIDKIFTLIIKLKGFYHLISENQFLDRKNDFHNLMNLLK